MMRNPLHLEERPTAVAGTLRLLGSTAITLVAALAMCAVVGWLAPGDFLALAARALGLCAVIGAAVTAIAWLGRMNRA